MRPPDDRQLKLINDWLNGSPDVTVIAISGIQTNVTIGFSPENLQSLASLHPDHFAFYNERLLFGGTLPITITFDAKDITMEINRGDSQARK